MTQSGLTGEGSNRMLLDVYLENSDFPPLLPTQTIGRQGPVVSTTIKEQLYGACFVVLTKAAMAVRRLMTGRGVA